MRVEHPRRLVYVITGLELGGAEVMLYELLGALDPARYRPAVISLSVPGPLEPRIAALGVPVESLGMVAGRPTPGDLLRLARRLRTLRPDLVQTWMYHADLLGGLAARLVSRAPVVWSLHNSNLDPRTTRWTTRATVRLCARLSRRVPARILSCSEVSASLHRALGYNPDKMLVIPNGFDMDTYRPNPAHYAAVRAELDLPPNALLVGLAARWHPQKDHPSFVAAAARVAREQPGAWFLLAGTGMTEDNAELADLIAASGAADRFRLLGPRSDMPRLNAALDVAVTASAYGEAFPLVVGEAMACGVPCVATDVGDSALLVGDAGRVVAPRDRDALAAAIAEVLALPAEVRCALGEAARARVAANFALPVIAGHYQSLYSSLLAGTH
jgi:glycosyltransferase involved in cell wall biosynthesis